MAKTRKGDHYKKGRIFLPEYIHTDYLEYWLHDFAKTNNYQSILNICCGESTFGNVRADISEDSQRTMHADLFKLLDYFPQNSFDMVYVDPPFEVYTSGENRFRWIYDAFKIARKCLMTRRVKVNNNMPSKWHDWVIAEDSRPSITLLRIDYK